ncbi:MAG TPA: DUF3501 family protein [Candidatus Polarisedimenticolia bacterium]|nr:DUF3501 family protein [Candidatus Polarisedimenticolia bacterium]
MEKLTLRDVRDLAAYEEARDRVRPGVIALKARRRVALGDRISLVFENRETALSQVQEMLRVERIVDPEKIQFEIDTYNMLIPEPGQLSATLFIEITDEADIRRELDRLIGLDRPGMLYLDLGGAGRVDALFEEGHSKEERISAVHYVRFPFTSAQRAQFLQPTGAIALVASHPNYQARAQLSETTRLALAEDLIR